MKIIACITALAVGLSLASAQAALAADQSHRHGRDTTTTSQQHQNDQGKNRVRTRTRNQNQNWKSNVKTDDRRIRTDRRRLETDQSRLRNDRRRLDLDRDRRKRDEQFQRQLHDRRYIERNRWRRDFHSRHRFHFGTYHGPRGYYYRRWHYGEYLPRIYFIHDFWLSDFLMFGLMAPPPGCIWVRFGPDALLIDTETGEIIQVVYNVFY